MARLFFLSLSLSLYVRRLSSQQIERERTKLNNTTSVIQRRYYSLSLGGGGTTKLLTSSKQLWDFKKKDHQSDVRAWIIDKRSSFYIAGNDTWNLNCFEWKGKVGDLDLVLSIYGSSSSPPPFFMSGIMAAILWVTSAFLINLFLAIVHLTSHLLPRFFCCFNLILLRLQKSGSSRTLQAVFLIQRYTVWSFFNLFPSKSDI